MSSYILIIYVVAFIAIFYFMAIRPQQRQRKAHQALLASLQKGDMVVTAAGIYGLVKEVADDTVLIEVAKGVNMRLARRAIVEIVRDKAKIRELTRQAQSSGGGRRGKRGRAQIAEETYEDYEAEASEGDEVAGAENDENAETVETDETTDESEENNTV